MRIISSLVKLLLGIIAWETVVLMKKDKKFFTEINKQKTFGDKVKLFVDKLWKFNKDIVDEWVTKVQATMPSAEEVLHWVHSSLKNARDIGIEKRNELDKTIQSKEKIKEVVEYIDEFKKFIAHINTKTDQKSSKKTK